jgi:hypothetical protein
MPRRAKDTGKRRKQRGKRYPLNMRTTYEIRQQLETAAAASGRSLAQEAELRIQQSFDQEGLRTLDAIASDMENSWARFGNAFHGLNQQGDLLRAAEGLIHRIQPLLDFIEGEEAQAIEEAIARIQTVQKMLEVEAGQWLRRMHTTGADQS